MHIGCHGLKQNYSLLFFVKVQDEDHFVRLYYDYDEVQDATLLKQQRVFNKFLDTFHKEVSHN